MKILLFGASGMLGACIRYEASKLDYEIISPSHDECDITNEDSVRASFQQVDVVINAAGTIQSITNDYLANATGPMNIAKVAKEWNVKFIHVSTDCVFSGAPSPWHDINERPDPVGMYGISKRYGEVAVHAINPTATIVRTSFIGARHGLMKWFLNLPLDSVVDGYDQAIWSGSTVNEVARKILSNVIPFGAPMEHLAIEMPMTKYEVLLELKKSFRPDVTVNRVKEPPIYRGLKPTMIMQGIGSLTSELIKMAK